jgi:hypothetical protein
VRTRSHHRWPAARLLTLPHAPRVTLAVAGNFWTKSPEKRGVQECSLAASFTDRCWQAERNAPQVPLTHSLCWECGLGEEAPSADNVIGSCR